MIEEIFLSMGIKILAIVLIGAPPVAVLLFEVVLNAVAMFNHGNVSIPSFLDRRSLGLCLQPVNPDEEPRKKQEKTAHTASPCLILDSQVPLDDITAQKCVRCRFFLNYPEIDIEKMKKMVQAMKTRRAKTTITSEETKGE